MVAVLALIIISVLVLVAVVVSKIAVLAMVVFNIFGSTSSFNHVSFSNSSISNNGRSFNDCDVNFSICISIMLEEG